MWLAGTRDPVPSLAVVDASERLDVLTSRRQDGAMNDTKRATIYLDAEVHRALRLKAAATNRSMSEMVNHAVRMALAEDAVDLAAVDQRVAEPSASFEAFVRDLFERGRL